MVGNDTIHTVTRKEHDCIGYMDVPKDVYWGIHTQRALGNFTVSRIADSTHPQLMRAYATVKRACAEANDELGLIDHDKARLIVAACRDVENGELADQRNRRSAQMPVPMAVAPRFSVVSCGTTCSSARRSLFRKLANAWNS